MTRLLDKIPYAVLIPIALIMLLAPFRPAPHVWEKLMMLMAGNLRRPIDIFDLIYHLVPSALLIIKLAVNRSGRPPE
jgi:hypothetical protein